MRLGLCGPKRVGGKCEAVSSWCIQLRAASGGSEFPAHEDV